MTQPKSPDAVRADVSEAYAEAIDRAASSCCQPSCCAEPASTVTRVGYTPEQLEAVPEEVANASFGCGSPLAFAGVQPGQTVLDLGAGAGLDLLLAAKQVGPEGRVIGVDMTDAMLERARANITQAGAANVEVRKGLIEDLPVEDASVDWVISNCVINLSPEKPRVFAEIQRVLKPGGRMRVSDIVVESLPDELRARRDLFTACIGGAITEADYLAGLRAAGLEEVEVADRLVYDEAAIRGFLASEELPATAADIEALSESEAASLAKALAGSVWSARITARKPG
jgi:ubiquinone/menaquinone biosynthesis C-methylase UbiE